MLKNPFAPGTISCMITVISDILGAAGFRVLSSFCFLRGRTRPAASLRPPCLIYLFTSNMARCGYYPLTVINYSCLLRCGRACTVENPRFSAVCRRCTPKPHRMKNLRIGAFPPSPADGTSYEKSKTPYSVYSNHHVDPSSSARRMCGSLHSLRQVRDS